MIASVPWVVELILVAIVINLLSYTLIKLFIDKNQFKIEKDKEKNVDFFV